MSELMLDVGQAVELKAAFRREGPWDNSEIKMLCERKGFLAQVREALLNRAKVGFAQPSATPFAISVDHEMSLADMLSAGRYDKESDRVTAQNFPVSGTGRVEYTAWLVHFDQRISSEDAIAEMEARNTHPATLTELLAFGMRYPDIQRLVRVLALGSWIESTSLNIRETVLLGGDTYKHRSYRTLQLHFWTGGVENEKGNLVDWGGGWGRHYRFLAIQN